MPHFGIFCPPMKGHLHPMLSIARRLVLRQHRVTFFQLPDLRSYVTATGPGVEFCEVGGDKFPAGTLARLDQQLSQLSGKAALRFTVERFRNYADAFLQEASDAVRSAGIDILLVDQVEIYGGAIAERLSIPFLNIAGALPFNPESGIPPVFTGWSYSRSPFAKLRNIAGYISYGRVIVPVRELVNAYRMRWGLQPLPTAWSKRGEAYSKVAQISQLPECLDFPRKALPRNFYATGIIMDECLHSAIPFPWERLNGKPLIYACLGTLQNGQAPVYNKIAEACSGLNAQLVISLGGGTVSEADLGPLPGNPVVVRYAPQDKIMSRASLLITHGGLNTALEAVSCGVPMVLIPIAHDQPGVAARMSWHRVGEVVPLKQLSVALLRQQITRVWNNPAYRERAQWFKAKLSGQQGVEQACEIIERSAFSAYLQCATHESRETVLTKN
jgi:zeaxanthin glucosyltransferase